MRAIHVERFGGQDAASRGVLLAIADGADDATRAAADRRSAGEAGAAGQLTRPTVSAGEIASSEVAIRASCSPITGANLNRFGPATAITGPSR
jgi:hypothetical protein